MFWAPARVATFDGQLGEVYLPCLYPGSHAHPDDRARLGRLTAWSELAPGLVRGAGTRLVLAGDESRTLFEIGRLQCLPTAAAPEA